MITAGLALVGMSTPALLRAQSVSISGTVVERALSEPIRGARVQLSGAQAVVTDSGGRFRTSVARPGRYVLTVSAIGYRLRSFELSLTADTTLRIEMERQPTVLDPTVVRGGNVTIRGRVHDALTGEFLLQGQVTIYPGDRTVGTRSGDFTFENAPMGEQITLVFEALEHLPKQITFVPGKDTSLSVALEVDSVGVRLVAQQARRLASRANAVPTSLDAVGRDEIRRSNEPSIGELVRHRLPPGSISERWPYKTSCVFYDDEPVTYDLVMHLAPRLIERVEIYGFRGRMIRVYSKRYVASLMGRKNLPRVFC